MTIGLVVLGMAVQSTTSMRYLYLHDIGRTRLNQSIRGSMDLIGTNIRQAGENFTSSFPAVELINGSSGNSDELVLRRNLLDESLGLCVATTNAGGNANKVIFANGSVTAGCAYTGNTQNYNAWRAYRLAQPSQQAKAYIFNIGSKAGEFFTYAAETDSGTTYNLTKSGANWQNNYTVGATAVYILEEWRFSRSGDVLQLVVNGDTANALNVAFGISDLQVSIQMQDGTTRSAFARTDDWTKIRALDIQINGSTNFAGRELTTALRSQFFPRNILSN